MAINKRDVKQGFLQEYSKFEIQEDFLMTMVSIEIHMFCALSTKIALVSRWVHINKIDGAGARGGQIFAN